MFEVKNDFIFRFPDQYFRNDSGVQLIRNEVKTLTLLKKHLNISIPTPQFVSDDPSSPYMGYEKLDGIPLSRIFLSLKKEVLKQLSLDISSFLSQLHSPELTKSFPNQNFSLKGYKQEWKTFYQKTQDEIFPLLTKSQKRWIAKLFTIFLDEEENFEFEPKVIHGDFDISNILYDPKTKHISGIVDFEETRIYDPAADLLFFNEGDSFLKVILKNYKYEINTGFVNRMKFLYGRAGLAYIFFGYKNNLPGMVKTGKEMLIKRMKQFPLK